MLFLTGFVLVKALPFFGDQLAGRKPPAPNGGRVEEIAQFLKSKKLGADDRVQPLDWTGGAVHAMLIAEARPATRFIYNYHFYHHISRPYIQHLRKELMEGLTANPPRLIIEVDASPRPTGIDTTTEFPELSSFIASTYRAAKRGDGYTVFERIEGSSTPKSATQTFRKN